MEPMKLWIDNEKDPALAPQFGLDPAGWTVARSVSEAIALIRSAAPDEIALDWDLGWGATGEDVILAVANLYGPGRRAFPKVASAPPGSNRATGCSPRCSLRRSIAGCWIATRASA